MEEAPRSLRRFRIFQGLDSQQLAAVACLLKPVSFADGAFLFREGDPAEVMLLIETGSVEVLEEVSETTHIRLAVLQEGDTVGEMALIDRHRRSASIRALEAVTGWSLDHEAMHDLRRQQESLFILIVMNIAREVSRQLHRMDKVFSNSLFQKGAPSLAP